MSGRGDARHSEPGRARSVLRVLRWLVAVRVGGGDFARAARGGDRRGEAVDGQAGCGGGCRGGSRGAEGRGGDHARRDAGEAQARSAGAAEAASPRTDKAPDSKLLRDAAEVLRRGNRCEDAEAGVFRDRASRFKFGRRHRVDESRRSFGRSGQDLRGFVTPQRGPASFARAGSGAGCVGARDAALRGDDASRRRRRRHRGRPRDPR
mmetsp:Transcript_10400/g.44249  ORF Transcript_10400/g.44249 Transcript_10400/m.44249 type:complete len:207 (+) Transcript_10400:685-1305(+)